jgi:predicted dehydrogenase
MWIRYMPCYKFLMEKLKEGLIGEPQHIECSLGYDLRKKERLNSPELAGGALLDLGVYPLNVFQMIFGMQPENMIASCMKLKSGVDAQFSLSVIYPKGKVASCMVTMLYKADNEARIYGSKGYLTIDNINCPNQIRVFNTAGEEAANLQVNDRHISGYEFQFMSARHAIITGRYEPVEMPHSESIRIMKMCDSLRNAWSIKFPMEEEEKKED